MELRIVTEILGLLQQGQIDQALTQVSAAISGLTLAGPTRSELAARVRGALQNEHFGVCDCEEVISPRRLADTNLTATSCTACARKQRSRKSR